MTFPRIMLYGSIAVFGFVGILALVKGKKPTEPIVQEIAIAKENAVEEKTKPTPKKQEKILVKEDSLPESNLIDRLFATDDTQLPIVETVTYNSRVPWLKGRPAWLADYASHFQTTRHFIARSLNKKPDYFTQKVLSGDRFNVLKKDLAFHLLIDLNKAKMRFYALDKATNERYLLKTYTVGLGRKDSSQPSGCLTPLGKYLLGNKVAIYKPGTVGYFQERKIEMIQVFGTRWIPFDKSLENAAETAKGYGIHGTPWKIDPETNQLVEDADRIGKYDSDGCVRLASNDMEEIFSIVISKPTTVELVKDFQDAELPGNERE